MNNNVKIKIKKNKFSNSNGSKMKITRQNINIKPTFLESHWNEKRFEKVIKIAKKLKYSEIILFLLENVAKESEESFNYWLRDIPKFSKQELIDIIYEIGPKAGEEFIEKFKDRIKIKIKKNKLSDNNKLKWTEKERQKLESRILNLKNDQIAALFFLLSKSEFSKGNLKQIVKNIKAKKQDSSRLNILINEINSADSKENLLWWIAYFEESNKK